MFVQMYIDATTMGNSMEVPQKVKNRNATWSSNPPSGYLPNTDETLIQSDTHPFIAALFQIAKRQRQPKGPFIYKWLKKIWHINIEWILIHRKRIKICHSSQHGWTYTVLCWVKLIRLRKPNSIQFHLLVESSKTKDCKAENKPTGSCRGRGEGWSIMVEWEIGEQ